MRYGYFPFILDTEICCGIKLDTEQKDPSFGGCSKLWQNSEMSLSCQDSCKKAALGTLLLMMNGWI